MGFNFDGFWQALDNKHKEGASTQVVVAYGFAIIFLSILLVVIDWAIATWLWNQVIPDLFNGPTITFWQMAFLNILISFLAPKRTISVKKGE